MVCLSLPSEEITKNTLFGANGLVNSFRTDYTAGVLYLSFSFIYVHFSYHSVSLDFLFYIIFVCSFV